MPALQEKVKVVIIGDGACGKTCLLVVFAQGKFPEKYIPTVFENYVGTLTINNKIINVELWDTAGQDDYDRLRPLSYPDTDVMLISFAIDSPDTLENVKCKWISEALHFCSGVPMMLIGLKSDKREQGSSSELVTYQEGVETAQQLSCSKYMECSALKSQGVQEIFTTACQLALDTRKVSKRNKKCIIL